MNEELELFCEDADEQLTFMENSLITMQEEGVDDESIGALFRSMHTIKGTAGMFGFDDLVSFTHVAENLLSEVRDGKVALTPEMIEIFLKVKDHAQKLVDLAIAGEALDEFTQTNNDELLKILKSMLFENTGTSVETNAQEQEAEQSNEATSQKNVWHISLRLKPNFFATGMDIINILSFFDMVGEVKNLLLIDTKIPSIEDINPTEAYIGYEILFESDAAYEEIEEIFEFVLDDIELQIFLANDMEKLQDLVDGEPGLREELVFGGFDYATRLHCNAVGKEPASVIKESKDEGITKVKEESHESVSPMPQAKTETKSPSKKETKKSFSLRVDSSKIDQLINQISEMVIANAKVSQRADTLDDNELSESATILSDMLEEIRTGIMNIRMVQVGDSFNKFKRIVHDVAKKVDKEIDFEIIGGETELDKMVVEKISDPLMHMLRNSIDHGIESPAERVKLGKNAKGQVQLKTYPDAGTIVIEISDDGQGLPKDKILAKAIANDLVSENNNLSDKEIYNLIFAAGLSTAEKVSDISGRGVGMDVVKSNIESLRGTVEIDSRPGEGSVFTIRLPLTLAIIDGFLVQSGKTKYIIPLDMIQECIELDARYKKEMAGNEFINLRDSMLPLLDIRTFFNEEQTQSERENVVVVRYGDYKIGMMVDELFGEFQTVIKPLGSVFSNVPGISGGTILGSGEIALIFDIPKLMEHKIREIN
jgi:two-component system chemotaxis sensor kinase CheA